ncbi:MAG: hypothetical protein ACE15D_00330 [Candidatus Eisenbacteria bacterium]|nr:hypothetical protein [Candidatus Eisenbacteria bacterium]
MFQKISLAILSLALAIALLPGCAGMKGSGHRESNSEVMLLSLGSTNGELAPCG